MPVYEYECQDCGKQFEAIQSINDKPLKICKFCNGTVSRLISRTSFALKGSGWFKDGYSNPPVKKEASKPDTTKKTKAPKEGKKVKSNP